MQLNISGSVGAPHFDGTPSGNSFDDVLVVQFLLQQKGNNPVPLPLDGALTPQLIAAISTFQILSAIPVNGRVDPGDATIAALNTVALSEFEGITDRLEQRSIILRPLRQWNFTRGSFHTLTHLAGLQLRFDSNSFWLPAAIQDRFIRLFNHLLSPSQFPAPTWGVHPFDWYHCHLGVWSGHQNVQVSSESSAWINDAVNMRSSIDAVRSPFLAAAVVPQQNVWTYTLAYRARMALPDVADLLARYSRLPQAVIVHHTFEYNAWRPNISADDPRRSWMVTSNGSIQTPPYRTSQQLNDAQSRREFICEGSIQINFLIDAQGVIQPVLGNVNDLSVITGLGSAVFLP